MTNPLKRKVIPPTLLGDYLFLNTLLAGFIGFLTLVLSGGGKIISSTLLHISTIDPIAKLAKEIDPNITLVNSASGYDGKYYYSIGIDPILKGHAHTLIDQTPYRYGHPLHGWLAYLFSFGNPRLVPSALLVITLLGMMCSAYIYTKLSTNFGYSRWLGLIVAVTPGMLFALQNSTTETVGFALVGFLLYYWITPSRFSNFIVILLSSLICLDKEQYTLIVLVLLLQEALSSIRNHTFNLSTVKRLASISSGLFVLAFWYIYIYTQLKTLPSHYENGNITVPFIGWIRTMNRSVSLQNGSFTQSQLGSLVTPVLIFYLVLLFYALVKALKSKSTLGFIALTQVLLIFCFDWRTLLYPHEMLREPAVGLGLIILLLCSKKHRDKGDFGNPKL